ncbi:conserved hypothetical protein [Alteromonas infernus]
MRLIDNQPPFANPCVFNASIAYQEQDGWKRQRWPNIGEMNH